MAENKSVRFGQKLRGAVLMMVVTVMFMLIILLLATLTVVSTAQNRAYLKYEENQAYYAARSALDVFKERLMSDNDYYAYADSGMTTARMYKYTDYDVTPPDYTKTVEMTQGRALELDMYDITAQNDAGIASNMLTNDDVFGGGTLNSDNLNYSIESITRPTSTPDYGSGEYYTYYKIEMPPMSDGTDSYGMICDDDEAIIKVEVLSRRYDSGGLLDEFSDAELLAATPSGIITNSQGDDIDIKKAIKEGSRSLDKMRVRITATTSFLGTEGVAIVEFDPKEDESPETDNALTTTGAFSGGSGANLSPAGGACTLNEGESTISDGNSAAGTVFTVGSIKMTSAATYTFDEADGMYAMKDITFANDVNIRASGPNAVMYAGGKITVKGSIGDAANPITVVCNEIEAFQNEYTVDGDIVTNKMYLINSSGTALQNGHFNGDVYVKELVTNYQIDTANSKIKVALPCNANIKLASGGVLTNTSGVSVNPSTYISAGYTFEYCQMDAGNLNPVNAGDTANISFCPPFDINSFSVSTIDNKIFREISVPSSIGTITIPTAQSMFAEYFEEGSFDANGDLVNKANGVTVDYSESNVSARSKSAEKVMNEINPSIFSTNSLDVYTNTVSGSSISSSGKLTSGGNITFDTSAGNLYIQLVPGTYYSGTWSVSGTNSVNFIMPEGTGKQYYFNNCRIESEKVLSSTTTITNGTTKAPKINYYCGTGAQISTQNNCFFAGYFYMPTAGFYVNNGCGTTVTYKSSANATATTVGNSAVVGSIICGEFTSSNKPGIIFLSSDSGKNDPGKTTFDWTPYQYRSNTK